MTERKMKGYLAGPISGRTEEEMTGWRDIVKKRFPAVTWLDPTEYGDGVDDNEKVNMDIRNVLMADIIVFMFDGPSIGTAMELRIAFETGRKFVVWWNVDEDVHLWVIWHSRNDKIVKSWKELVATLHLMLKERKVR